jgi:hypothetical protein
MSGEIVPYRLSGRTAALRLTSPTLAEMRYVELPAVRSGWEGEPQAERR